MFPYLVYSKTNVSPRQTRDPGDSPDQGQRRQDKPPLRFLFRPSKPNTPRPVAKSGSVVGSGVHSGFSRSNWRSRRRAIPSGELPPSCADLVWPSGAVTVSKPSSILMVPECRFFGLPPRNSISMSSPIAVSFPRSSHLNGPDKFARRYRPPEAS